MNQGSDNALAPREVEYLGGTGIWGSVYYW
jgi:hypothetical protein